MSHVLLVNALLLQHGGLLRGVLRVSTTYYLLLMLLYRRMMHLLLVLEINHPSLTNVMRGIHLHVALRPNHLIWYHGHLMHLHLPPHVWWHYNITIIVH